MAEIVAEDQPFERDVLSKHEALEVFADHPFKGEIIEGVDEAEGAGGERGDRLPQPRLRRPVPGPAPALRPAGSPPSSCCAPPGPTGAATRTTPSCSASTAPPGRASKGSDEYLHRLEEARKRDHRKLGVELDLFSFPSELGSGLAVWHPKGASLRRVMEDYSRRTHLAHGYDLVASPHIAKADLWQTSGHLDFYAEGMYPGMELDDGDEYRLKPMNCPFHILIFGSRGRSYRELPLRLFELGTVYRYERSGVVHGLLRARGFTQDDSHIFARRRRSATSCRACSTSR